MDGARKGLLAVCCAIAGSVSSVKGMPFTPGDIVVFEAGDGSVDLNSGTASACALLEFSPTVINQSTPVQTIPLPTVDSGSQHALTTAGQHNDHLMTLSSDGRYLSVLGYDVPAGSNYIDSSGGSDPAYATPNRTIARIDGAGNVDTSTAGPFGLPNTYTRGTASLDGSGFWYTTNPVTSAAPGLGYVAFGSSTPAVLSSSYSGRGIDAYGGQLYASSTAANTLGISTIGSGTPISGTPPINVMSNTGNAALNLGTTGFFMATMKPGDTSPDVLYVCDYNYNGEIDKYSLSGGTWVWNGDIPEFYTTDLTGSVSNGVVTLYTTSTTGGSAMLSSITDAAGYNARPSSTTITTLASISTNNNTIGLRGLALAPTYGAAAGSAVWNSSTGGSWSASVNWIGGVPNAIGAGAVFGAGGSVPQTILIDAPQTVGSISFASSIAYTIGGASVLTVSNASTPAVINILAGGHTITAPLVITNGLSVTTAADPSNLIASLTLPLNINAIGSLVKAGPGTLAFAGSSAGITVLTLPNMSVTAGAIRLNNGTRTSNRTLLSVGTLTTTGGSLDVGSNDIDIQNSSLATISAELAGGGITSSTITADTTHLTRLGVIQNSTNGTPTGSPLYGSGAGTLGLFDGVNPSASDVLIKFTYVGDANLDGKVDGSDYSRIDTGYLNHLAGWYNGDFNYDGVVDGSDFTLIDNAFNGQGASHADQAATPVTLISPVSSTITAVPEPVVGVWVLLAAARQLGRRRNRRIGVS